MTVRKAEERLRRLLVMLPWLMEAGEVPLVDVAERFDMTTAQVQQDLELVAMCGLPPFVDEMIDVFVDDGIVYVGVPRLFTRPLRLTAPEGFSLLASARAAMELPGADPDGPLGRGLVKLAAALGAAGIDVGVDDTAGVVVDLPRPELTDELVDAAAAGAELDIGYYTPARDQLTERTIVARHVFADTGHWYVVADDDRSGERRTFRVDRIEWVSPTGRNIASDDVVAAPDEFFVDAQVPRATLLVGPAARWVVEQYPVDEVEELDRAAGRQDGWVQVRLPMSNARWMSRLLIRLGADAEVVEPPGAATDASALAARILERYRT